MTRKTNEERLGLPSTGAKESGDIPFAASMEEQTPDSILSYVRPTTIVDLPSQGKYYKEGHPLHGKVEIEIKEMTAKEEDLLTSRSLIKKGVVFDRLLQSLMVDKSVKLDDLLIGDKNALLIGARIDGYGSEYKTTITCPGCGITNVHEFDLLGCPIKGPVDWENTEDEELKSHVEETEDGTFLISLPKSNVTAEVRLLTGLDERRSTAAQEMRKKKKLPENQLTEHFKSIVVSLNGVEDSFQMSSFLENMPASDSRFLRKVFGKITPNIEMKQEFVCSECDHEQAMEVPFTADFFWPDQ